MGSRGVHVEPSWVAAVVVAVVRGDRVLALRRAPTKVIGAGRWESVSGKIDPGEPPLSAARREVLEETGLAVTVEPRPVDSYVAAYGERPMLVVVYRANAPTGDVVLSREHDAWAWLLPSEIEARGSWPELVLALERALAADGRGTLP